MPMNYDIFSLWLLRTGTISSPVSDSELLPLILSGGSLSSVRWFSSMIVPFRTSVTVGGLERGELCRSLEFSFYAALSCLVLCCKL